MAALGRGLPSSVAEQKESRVLEGHLMPDHVHTPLSIAPKYAVSDVVEYIKGKSAIYLARSYGEHKQNLAARILERKARLRPRCGVTNCDSGVPSQSKICRDHRIGYG
jgi:REP element-mobilizing transposase RayT